MRSRGVIAGGVAAAVIIGIIVSYFVSQSSETVNLDMGKTNGTVSTAMGSPILGNPSAPITIIEFGDYQCPNCYRWYHTVKPDIYENFIKTGKANLVFVDLALLGKDSPKAAEATYCAEDQGKYWEYHDLLYQLQHGIDDGWASSEKLKEYASGLGLDMDLFSSSLDSGKFEKRIQYNIEEAIKQGATGTPTFIIVGPDGTQEKISGAQPYSVFKSVIESMI